MAVEQSRPTVEDIIDSLNRVSVISSNITTLPKLRGIMRGDVFDNEGQLYKPALEGRDIWENVSEHTGTAFLVTDVLGEALGLSTVERAKTNLAAWLHDSGKPTEIIWDRTIREQHGRRNGVPRKRLLQSLEAISAMEEWENAEAGIPPEVSN